MEKKKKPTQSKTKLLSFSFGAIVLSRELVWKLLSSYFSDYNHTSKRYRDVLILYKNVGGLRHSEDRGSSC